MEHLAIRAVGPRDLYDVAIVGAGLAGTLAAVALAREGCCIALLDLQSEPQPEFRAEQLVGPLVDKLAGLGALTAMTKGHPLEPVTLDTRLGHVVQRTCVSQYGVPYQSMVKGARAALPSGVVTRFGRVTAAEIGPDEQAVTMADGTRVAARLLVLATGLSTALPKRLGFSVRTLRRDHSVTLGFDVERLAGGSAPPPFVQHPATLKDRVDYLAVFPMGEGIRANLFSYQERGSAWIRDFCQEPGPMLGRCMPGLERLLGPYRITGAVQSRSNDLRVIEKPARDGVVIVGDAFQTPCPAAGTGIDRLMSDVTVLARHVPMWLSTPGMVENKVATYYADPEKRAADAEALRIAEYRRAVSTEQSLGWAFHRGHVALRRRLRLFAADAAQILRPAQPTEDARALTT